MRKHRYPTEDAIAAITSDLNQPIAYMLSDGNEHFDKSMALGMLLLNEQAFCNTRECLDWDGSPGDKTVVCYVNCNDVFAWGMADAEPFTVGDIPDIYRMWESDRVWGVAKWCCRKRNEQPQRPVIEGMKKDGAWEDWMDELGDNRYDSARAKLLEADR